MHLTDLNPTISPFLQDGGDVIWHSQKNLWDARYLS